MDLKGKTIILGVSGGIAAYWVAEIIGVLKNKEMDVHVVMTQNAKKFITPLTLQTISGNKVLADMFELINDEEIGHIACAQRADLILVAPTTANLIGKIAGGIADDLLSTIIIATQRPVVICPAMNDKMWANPIVQENVKKLKKYGYYFADPKYGEMACGGKGVGRLANIETIINRLKKV